MCTTMYVGVKNLSAVNPATVMRHATLVIFVAYRRGLPSPSKGSVDSFVGVGAVAAHGI